MKVVVINESVPVNVYKSTLWYVCHKEIWVWLLPKLKNTKLHLTSENCFSVVFESFKFVQVWRQSTHHDFYYFLGFVTVWFNWYDLMICNNIGLEQVLLKKINGNSVTSVHILAKKSLKHGNPIYLYSSETKFNVHYGLCNFWSYLYLCPYLFFVHMTNDKCWL